MIAFCNPSLSQLILSAINLRKDPKELDHQEKLR